MTGRREDGAAVVVALGLRAVLFLVAGVGGGVVAVIATHRQVQAAADLAALAGAAAVRSGTAVCPTVQLIATRNGADGARCDVEGREVVVTVERILPRFLGGRVLRARARAGPATGGGP